jgi:hypothetical protein
LIFSSADFGFLKLFFAGSYTGNLHHHVQKLVTLYAYNFHTISLKDRLRIVKENIFGSEGFSIIDFCELYFLYYNHACGQ